MNEVPTVKVKCRVCRMDFELPADHEDVAHPYPGPICWWCEDEERDLEKLEHEHMVEQFSEGFYKADEEEEN